MAVLPGRTTGGAEYLRPTLQELRRFAGPPRISYQGRVVDVPHARYHGAERDPATITAIVLHVTDSDTAESAIGWLNRPDVPPRERGSYHYPIERDGTIRRMLSASVIAYHSGRSRPPGAGGPLPIGPHESVNAYSLGIAFVAREGSPITAAQIESGLWLSGIYAGTGQVTPDRIWSHDEVAPDRKRDLVGVLDMDVWRELVRLYMRSEG